MEPNFFPEKIQEDAASRRSIAIGGIIEKTAAVIHKEGVSENLQNIIGKDFDFGEDNDIGQILRIGLENATASELETINNKLENYLKEKGKSE